MQQEFISNFSQYGKTAIDSTKELVAINGRLMTKFLESQIKFATTCVESSANEVDIVADAKDPQAFLASQGSIVEKYTGVLKAQAETNVKVFQEAGEEFKTWFEKGIKTADAAVKEAAETAKSASTAVPVVAKKKPAVKKSATKQTATAKKPAAKKAPAKKAAAKKTETAAA